MAKEIKMPQLSDTMDSGKIVTWFKKEGDSIERGDILAEVETDKANLEIEAFDAGTLLKITAAENESVAVGETIAFIGEAGEEVDTSSSSSSKPAKEPEPVAQEEAPAPEIQTTPEPTPVAQQTVASSDDDRIKASPLAKKIAQAKNISLSGLSGSGPNGRIIKKDLEGGAASSQAAPSTPTPAAPPKPQAKPQGQSGISGGLSGQYIELNKMRTTIARRMQESMQTSPHFYMTSAIDMRESKKLREALKVKEEFKGLSLNHFIIKAAGYALAKVPMVNAAMQGEKIFVPDQVNIGVITALEDGLLIPVIHNVDQKKLMQVATETREAIARARAGTPSSSDLTGGTFSISNMGMFDVDNFTAIINPGQGAIMAVSSMKETPVVEEGKIVPGLEMKVTISVDHRIIDGVAAAQFLKHFKEAMELPALLLV